MALTPIVGNNDNTERGGELVLRLILNFYAYLIFLFKLGTHPYNQQYVIWQQDEINIQAYTP